MNEAYINSFGPEELVLLNREDAKDTKEELEEVEEEGSCRVRQSPPRGNSKSF